MQNNLAGIKVVDFSQVLAGPHATALLAQQGASVLKIEQPGAGDQMRGMMAEGRLAELGLSPGFLGVNAGKRSIALDLKHPGAKDIVRRMLADADVVVQNYKGGVIERLGFGYEAVKKIKPDIVYCAISGYGQEGPRAGVAAYDGAIQAASGMMATTGTPETGPIRAGYMVVDISTGLTAAYAIMSALYHRKTTGQGQYIDVAMFDTALTMMNPVVCNWMIAGIEPQLLGNGSQTMQPTAETWPTADGYLQITAITNSMVEKLCNAMGRPEWFAEARYRTDAGRIQNAAQVREEIGEILKTDTTDNWIDRLRAAGIPTSKVNSIPQALEQEQLAFRKVLMNVPAPRGLEGTVTIPGPAFCSTAGAPGVSRAAPTVGEHTDEILCEHSYSQAEIAELRRAGAVG